MGGTPAYASTMLPSVLVGGSGVGLVLPTLAAAVTAGLPPARRATGSAVYAMSRQLGAVLGVAGCVSLLDGAAGGDPVEGFRHGWILVVGAALLAACAAGALRERAPAEVSAVDGRPAEAQA
jgi:MFS family permease